MTVTNNFNHRKIIVQNNIYPVFYYKLWTYLSIWMLKYLDCVYISQYKSFVLYQLYYTSDIYWKL